MKKKSRIYSDSFSVNLNRALRFLSFRPRSEKEIRDYFKIKNQKSSIRQAQDKKIKIDEKIIESIIKKLKENKFINDEEFVKWWIEQRTRIKPRASRLIKFELKQKGISDELIQNSELRIKNDFEKAMVLAEKRMPRYKNEEPKKVYEKMSRFLASKGFDYDIIKQVIDQVLSKGYNKW